jgi:hypothetical protein
MRSWDDTPMSSGSDKLNSASHARVGQSVRSWKRLSKR